MADNQTKVSQEPNTAPKICFVIPYFGNWPFWFPYFLESCRANPDINWLLHSNCGIPADLPSNVRIIQTTFEAYCQRVSNSLGIVFRPSSPYKLCDLKPALGYIHRDELSGYDFWAFGDIDLVYGNLRGYFTTDRLSRFDLYSTHQRRISGHCCLLRNTHLMREAFMRVANWKSLLSINEHVAFDESAFSHLFIRHKNWPIWLANLVKPLNQWTRRTENVEAFTTPNGRVAWIDGSRSFPATWYWDHGQLTNEYDKRRTYPYFHFMVWKQQAWQQNAVSTRANNLALAARKQWQMSSEGFR